MLLWKLNQSDHTLLLLKFWTSPCLLPQFLKVSLFTLWLQHLWPSSWASTSSFSLKHLAEADKLSALLQLPDRNLLPHKGILPVSVFVTGLGNAEQISLVPVKKYWTELTCTFLWLSGCTIILLLVLNDVKDIVYYFDLFCRDWLGIIYYFPKRRYMVWSLSCFPDNPKTSISQCGHLMGKKIWIFFAVWVHRPVVTSGLVKIQN